MRTKEPIKIEGMLLRPGHTRAKVISEVRSGKAKGTRRAIKVVVKVGKKEVVGWASRKWFKYESIYEAKKRRVAHGLRR